MSKYHLNHVNIRATDLEETRDFYAQVLGLEIGFRPPFPNPGYWMYASDMPVVHISPLDPESPPRTNPDGMGKGLDHFALWGSGLAEQLAVLEKHGIEYSKRLAGGGRVIQVFFNDPNGVQIELGFNPEAEGITAENFDGKIHE
ncbi:MAG: VOC family protein [Alphaproteobacteria bacterium]|nr:VOC family protein [Alphaproteobacteria bacterium]MDP6831062.1 VOC family protein [Alphaproteobacteria bacterium]MDP6874089.1 VOC family protein [Alphaproteobacteria bacterium]